MQANLKSLINSSSAGLSPSNGLYLKSTVPIDQPAVQPETSSGGLSTGAVVGIAAGVAAVAAAGVAAGWVLLRRRRRALRTGSAAAGKASGDGELEAAEAAADSGTAGSACGDAVVLGMDDSQAGASASSAPPSAGTGHSTGSRSSGALAAAGGGPRGVTHPADGPAGPRRAASSPFAGGPRGGTAWAAGAERSVQHPADAGQGPGGPRGGGMARVSPFAGGPRSARPSLDATPPCLSLHDQAAVQLGGSGGAAQASPFAAGGACPASAFAGAASALASSGTDGSCSLTPPAGAGAAGQAAAVLRSKTVASPFAAARARAAAAAAASAGPSRTASGPPSGVTTPAVSFGAWPAGTAPITRGGPASTSDSAADSHELPELAAHVAQCDAAMSWAGDGVGGALAREHSLIQPSSLPSSLRWVLPLPPPVPCSASRAFSCALLCRLCPPDLVAWPPGRLLSWREANRGAA